MIVTLREQIVAAGGIVANTSGLAAGQTAADADIVLLVNNFSEKKQVSPCFAACVAWCSRCSRLAWQQLEAPNQPSGGSIDQYSMFTPYLLTSRVIGFADNRLACLLAVQPRTCIGRFEQIFEWRRQFAVGLHGGPAHVRRVETADQPIRLRRSAILRLLSNPEIL